MKTSLADKYFSLYIRVRDADENGCAKCCTCGTYKPVKEMDCGHFVKRQHMATRFSEVNCATQCKRCNAFEQGRDNEFAQFIAKKYGAVALVNLQMAAKTTRKISKFELGQIAKYYKERAIELAKAKGITIW